MGASCHQLPHKVLIGFVDSRMYIRKRFLFFCLPIKIASVTTYKNCEQSCKATIKKRGGLL